MIGATSNQTNDKRAFDGGRRCKVLKCKGPEKARGQCAERMGILVIKAHSLGALQLVSIDFDVVGNLGVHNAVVLQELE